MQFPVPQFTDVEDKLIGPLTLKQFGILFGGGIVVFLSYSLTKSLLVVIFTFILVGLPALVLAFAQINGRPVYSTIGYFIKFLSTPRILIFHKEVGSFGAAQKLKDIEVPATSAANKVQPVQNTQANLKEVQELLRKTANQESDIADKMK